VASGFFQHFLPAPIAKSIDWTTLERREGSFIDETLNERASDLLFKVNWKNQPLFLHCLFEHQSQPDPLMPLRMLRYMLRIWDQYLSDGQQTLPLPAILPIVLHQNHKSWNTHCKFSELFSLSSPKTTLLRPYLPDFCFHLIDLAEFPFDELRNRTLHRTILYT